MAYIVPSPQIYQQLGTPAGVANSVPDLDACIVGPAYNVLTYIAGSVASQVQTAALSTTITTGSIVASSAALTVAAPGGFAIGDTIIVYGAGTSGSNLQATITAIAGLVFTINTLASTTIVSKNVYKLAHISSTTGTNTFGLPGQLPGQAIDTSSIKVWLNNCFVQTGITGGRTYTTSNVITINTPSTTGGITSGLSSLVVGNAKGFVVGDVVTIAGAGTAGGLYTGTITNIVSTTLTVTPAAVGTVFGAAVNKVPVVNQNSLTNTLKLEAGDTVRITYTNTSSQVVTFVTTAQSLVTSSGNNGNWTTITTADMMPSDLSFATVSTGVNTAGTTITVAASTGFVSGDNVIIRGAGVGGADYVGTVNTVPNGTSITLNSATSSTINAGASVLLILDTSVAIWKQYHDQQVPTTRPVSGGSNYDVSNTGVTGNVVIQAAPELSFGVIKTADIYFGYRALRSDLSGSVLSFTNVDDIVGTLGDTTDSNPLGLACTIAMANTIGRIKAVAIPTNDLAGYQSAQDLLHADRAYFICPLTQDTSILASWRAHVDQMSTPVMASWRILLCNTAIPVAQNIGPFNSNSVNANSGSNTITQVNGNYVLTASNATFITDGVIAGDTIYVTASTGSPTQVGAHTITSVVSNQQVIISATALATAVSYYVTRALSKSQQATAVAAVSSSFNDKRVVHVQPDTVGVTVSGVVKYLPGYYLCAGLAGMGSGFAVQQGFTNISVAGIEDLKFSNFWFNKVYLNVMAAAGTLIFVQDVQGGIPYCRHELTTDMSVLQNRELLVVKNWDFLAYFYYDKIKPFIGSWNITKDTLNTIRQTLNAASELLKSQKLPKIGPPLIDAVITLLQQDPLNQDQIDVNMQLTVVYPNNYTNIYLII